MVDDMRVYIANLGKYNEGELVGDWFSFPIDEEDVAERIGLNSYYDGQRIPHSSCSARYAPQHLPRR